MRPFPYAGSTALVTGASSGIGAAFAAALARRGADLVLVARSRAGLEAEAERIRGATSATVTVLPCDLSDHDARTELVAQLARREIDVLINNAGVGGHGRFSDTEVEHELAEVSLNCGATVHLSREFLPAMLSRGRGGIINTASTAAFQACPGMATYGATKAFVLSFSEALGVECRRSGVRVLAFCPGPVATGFAAASGDAEFATHVMFLKAPTAERVVPTALRAFDLGRLSVVQGNGNRLGVLAAHFAPRAVVARIAGWTLRSM